MKFACAIVIVAQCASPRSLYAQTLRDLERGTLSSRSLALDQLLETPRDQRPGGWVAAVEREARRMEPKVIRGGTEEATHYAAGLIKALAEASDPSAIPILIDYSPRTRFATDGLVALGDRAVPLLIGTATDFARLDEDADRRSGAFRALIRAVQAGRLSERYQEQVLKLGKLLNGSTRMFAVDIVHLSQIALLSNQPDLRRVVEALALDPAEWHRRGIMDPGTIEDGQRNLRLELRKRATK